MNRSSLLASLVVLAATAALALPHSALADKSVGASFGTINQKMDDMGAVLGPSPSAHELSVQRDLTAIRDKLSPNMTRSNPKFVWAAPMNHGMWVIEGKKVGSADLFFTAHNPSAQSQKVRLQGFFGGLLIFERDTEVASGQTRPLLSPIDEREFLITRLVEDSPLPITWVVSSNAKVVLHSVLSITSVRIVADADFAYGVAVSTPLELELLNCAEAGATCRYPESRVSWDYFSERYELGR